jgi:hypothetical protein
MFKAIKKRSLGLPMKRNILLIGIITLLISFFAIASIYAGGHDPYRQRPELDYSLMGFKEQGVWYFPCVAPQYPVKIGPSYVTYGPPPPPCAPAPTCEPVSPMGVK